MAVPATLAFDYPTLAALTDFVAASTRAAGQLRGSETMSYAEQPRAANLIESDVLAGLQRILLGILGSSVPIDQPLMEVDGAEISIQALYEHASSTESYYIMLSPSDQIHYPYFQAGLDSLGAVELRNAIASEFGIEVTATLAFDYPTVNAVAGFILAALNASSTASLHHGLQPGTLASRDSQSITEIIAAGCRYPGCGKGKQEAVVAAPVVAI